MDEYRIELHNLEDALANLRSRGRMSDRIGAFLAKRKEKFDHALFTWDRDVPVEVEFWFTKSREKPPACHLESIVTGTAATRDEITRVPILMSGEGALEELDGFTEDLAGGPLPAVRAVVTSVTYRVVRVESEPFCDFPIGSRQESLLDSAYSCMYSASMLLLRSSNPSQQLCEMRKEMTQDLIRDGWPDKIATAIRDYKIVRDVMAS